MDKLTSIGTSHRAAVKRILATFDKASASDLESGARWYASAELTARQISLVGGVSVEQAAAVLAHLSPRTTWTRNVDGAWALTLTGLAPGCIGANVSRARAVLDGSAGSPGDSFGPNAHKTRAFYANILGDQEAVTVDVWAARIALLPAWRRGDDTEVETQLKRVGIYSAIAKAYRSAARARGVSPATMQAVTWIVARNGRAN